MYLCLACNKEIKPNDPRIDDTAHQFYGRCPECGHKGLPVETEQRLTVSITWTELRILTIWAERWASQCDEKDPQNSLLPVVYGIAERLQAQHMNQKVGLTFRSELAELSAMGLNYKQNVIKEE